MKPEQQRIAIAKACGWKNIKIGMNGITLLGGIGGRRKPIPDYLNDLNAMHEAEKILKLGMRNRYDAELSLIAKRDYCFIWETSAEQKAEAFLRTLNLWEE